MTANGSRTGIGGPAQHVVTVAFDARERIAERFEVVRYYGRQRSREGVNLVASRRDTQGCIRSAGEAPLRIVRLVIARDDASEIPRTRDSHGAGACDGLE